MRSVEGIVTIVQEGRFQLIDDNGVAHLFLLGYGAAVEPEQLPPLQHAQTRVRVSYRPAPDLIGHRAVRIMLANPRRIAPLVAE
jgi:hypothetical protein